MQEKIVFLKGGEKHFYLLLHVKNLTVVIVLLVGQQTNIVRE